MSYIRVSGIPKGTLDRFSSLVKSQLNVKRILFESDVGRFAQKEIRLNAKKLGPVLKGELKTVTASVDQGDFTENKDGSLLVGNHKILWSDYTEHFSSLDEKEAVWSGTGIILCLCLEISQELKIKGLARNLNRIVQDLRKRLDLPYEQRISLCIEADGMYGQSLAVHKDWLMAQSLADRLEYRVVHPQFEQQDKDGTLKVQVRPLSK